MPSLYEPFPGLPPFPDTVPTAPLLKISLAKLLRHDKEEEQNLWEACCDLGFFYLDLRSDGTEGDTNGYANEHSNGKNGPTTDVQIDGESLLRDADQLFKVGEELFDLPVEEKQKYDFAEQGSYFGYKGYGSGIVDKKGTKDRNEFYNVCYLLSSFSPFVSISVSLTQAIPNPTVACHPQSQLLISLPRFQRTTSSPTCLHSQAPSSSKSTAHC